MGGKYNSTGSGTISTGQLTMSSQIKKKKKKRLTNHICDIHHYQYFITHVKRTASQSCMYLFHIHSYTLCIIIYINTK